MQTEQRRGVNFGSLKAPFFLYDVRTHIRTVMESDLVSKYKSLKMEGMALEARQIKMSSIII